MSQSLAPPKPTVIYAADVASFTVDGHKIEKQKDGTHLVRRLPIFRAGTFRDEWGDQQTWTVEHLQQMVDHYHMLSSRNVFPNVPVRTDHTRSVDKIVGYLKNVEVDGEVLVGDLEITEPPAAEKLARKTYRSRSIEIGMYETNSGELYWPVVMGVAFVDIPAVEGLHSKDLPAQYFSRVPDKEFGVPKNNVPATTTDSTSNAGAAANPPAPPMATFRIAGVETTDFAKVQAHIDALEKFADETRESSRKAFVAGLARNKKIAATQVEPLTTLALAMDEAQFDAFTKAYEAAPELSLFAKHGDDRRGGDPEAERHVDDRLTVLEETLALHRRAGLSEDKIKQTATYREWAALNVKS